MQRIVMAGVCSVTVLLGLAVSARADSALESWGSIGAYFGNVGFQGDEVDIDRDYDRLIGVRLNAGLPLTNRILGQFDLVEEMSIVSADDNDETRRSGIVAAHLNFVEPGRYSLGVFGGLGRTQDNGDDDVSGDSPTSIPFNFAGLEASLQTGPAKWGAMLGALTSDDNYGETYDNAKFLHLTADFQVRDATTLGVSFSRLFGDRWNSDVPNDNQGTIIAFGLSLAHQLESKPISFWAEFDRMTFDSEGESDDPWVNELRVGVAYHFGGQGASAFKSGLPKINRWISIAANEIE